MALDPSQGRPEERCNFLRGEHRSGGAIVGAGDPFDGRASASALLDVFATDFPLRLSHWCVPYQVSPPRCGNKRTGQMGQRCLESEYVESVREVGIEE